MKWYNKHLHYTYYKNMIPNTYILIKNWFIIVFLSLFLTGNWEDIKTANKLVRNHFKLLLKPFFRQIKI